MPNELNQFATFKPIEIANDSRVQEARQYYQDNGLVPDNPFMTKFLDQATTTQSIPNISTPSKDMDIAALLANKLTKAPLSTPDEALEAVSGNAKRSAGPIPKNAKEFIKMYGPAAQEASWKSGVAKDLLLAQVALETEWGKYAPGYNFAGIKADSSWTGKSQTLMTKEQGKNGLYSIAQKFRVYDSPEEGFKGYISFLMNNKRYKPLVGVSDPYVAADIMSKTGYATDKNYKSKLQSVIKMIQSSNK